MKFLHVGCGRARKEHTVRGFNTPEWQEVRFDIDPAVEPDIVGTIVDMKSVPTGAFDAVYSAHNVEHVYPHEVANVLREFHRVLNDDGFLVVTCPDLQSVCEALVRNGLEQPLYEVPVHGAITPLDVLYGHGKSIAAGQHYMAHRGGFTLPFLLRHLRDAGFKSLYGGARPKYFDLWEIAFKKELPDDEILRRAPAYLP